MLERLLSDEQIRLVRDERALLDDARVLLARLGASDEHLDLLKRSLAQLDELFLLVVVGEFNAGKTAFLNALIGNRLLPEGVTPTTAHIHLLRHGDLYHHEQVGEDYVTVYLPVEWLREINLVDTPGTNAVIQRHQQITERFIPQSDLVLFVTSADRPFSESERAFLERIREWGKKVVIVVNKIDLIQSQADRETILAFVRENALQLLGVEPQIFPVSARLAQVGRGMSSNGAAPASVDPAEKDAAWRSSLFEPLETYLLRTLDTGTRFRFKLENPLGVVDKLAAHYVEMVAGRQETLRGDFETLDNIDAQLAIYEEDMRRDFQHQASRVDNVLYAMTERGDRFFDETMRLGRIFDLVNGPKISAEFDRQVVADTSHEIERHVNELINWMVDKDFRQWKSISDYLDRRWSQHADHIVGQVSSDFELTRQSLIQNVGRESQRIVESYDREAEATKLAQEVQKSIVQTAAIEAGALGLGAVLVVALHTTLLDFTGILSAGVLAAIGFYVLPYRRQQMKNDLRQRIGVLREKLHTALNRQFDDELQTSVARIRGAIAPYTRFVRVERERLERAQVDLGEMTTRIASARARVGKIK